jgi:hypothetical protein
MFNLKKYAGEHFIKPDDVRDHPLRRQIAVVREGKFGKLDLLFETGGVFSLNGTNTTTLLDYYGSNSDNLIGKEIDLYLGKLKYNGTLNDAVLVKPISPPDAKPLDDSPPIDDSPPDDGSPPPVQSESEFDDEIPF